MKTNNYSDINKEEIIVKKRKGEKIEIMAKKKKCAEFNFSERLKRKRYSNYTAVMGSQDKTLHIPVNLQRHSITTIRDILLPSSRFFSDFFTAVALQYPK